MAKKRVAVIVAALLMFSLLPGLALGAEVSLDLSSSDAAVGESVTAFGNAGPNEWVCIKVVDSSGNIVVFDAVKSTSSGDYSYSFKFPQISPGMLTVIAGCGNKVDNKTLQILGDGSVPLNSIAITKSADKVIYAVYEKLEINGLEVTGFYSDGSFRVEYITTANITGFDSSEPVAKQTLTITVGDKKATYVVTISESITATENETIVINPDIPLSIIVPENISNAEIKVTQSTPLPLIKVISKQVDMTIPNETTSSGSDTIQLPDVKPSSSVDVAAAQSVDLVIKVGSDTDTITFSKPVRLVLKGQGKKSAGFIDHNGDFYKIAKPVSLIGLTSDADVDAVAAVFEKEGIQEGAVVSEKDLIIWTKHFTRFIAYTPLNFNPPIISPVISSGFIEYEQITRSQIVSSRGGIIKIEGAVFVFPANAVSKDIELTIKKLSKDEIPSVSSGFRMLGEVYEITTDKECTFKKPITIILYFDQDEVDNDKYDVGIYCWNNKEWVPLDQVKANLETGKVSGTVNHFSIFAILLSEKIVIPVIEEIQPDQDVLKPITLVLTDITNHWAIKFITELESIGAVSGYPDGTFRPDNTITRAEFAAMLVKAFKLEPKSGIVFSDTMQHWAKYSIGTAAAHGIVSGYDHTTFGPDDPITREQMAVMLSKAARLSGGEGKIFADNNQIADWAADAVAATSSKNIINGYQDNTFKPQANATRAEAVTVIVKALKHF